MRFHERALNLKFKKGLKRPEKSNSIDLLCSGLVPKDGDERDDFERNFDEVPMPFSQEEREAWLKELNGIAVSSDAFVSATSCWMNIAYRCSFPLPTTYFEPIGLEQNS